MQNDCIVSHMTKSSATRKDNVLREFRVREILDAACRVVALYGFQGATVERVAEEADIAKGTIYLYFQNQRWALSTPLLWSREYRISPVNYALKSLRR